MSRPLSPRGGAALLLAMLAVCAIGAPLRAQSYYVLQSDGSVTPVYNQDPSSVSPNWWSVKCYRRGTQRGVKANEWGSLDGDSPADAMRQWRKAQHDEEVGDHYSSTRSRLTYFNCLGPIAVFLHHARGATENRPPDVISFEHQRPEPSPSPQQPTGRLAFWTNGPRYLPITVTVNDRVVGMLTRYVTSGQPGCGDAGTLTVDVPAGTAVDISARGSNVTWRHMSTTVSAGGCKPVNIGSGPR